MAEAGHLVELQVKSAETGNWVVTNPGVSLLYPDRYVERFTKKGKEARCLDPFTREIIAGENQGQIAPREEACPLCEEAHPQPWDGSCLL